MELGITILSTVLGSAGLFSFVQFMVSRHDGRNKSIAEIQTKLNSIARKCDRNELATNRLQLLFLIEAQPQNKDTILQTAQRYFTELDGDGEAWAVFYDWAEKNKLDVGWYKALLEREKGKK